MAFLAESMSWEQINQALSRFGYHADYMNKTISKDGEFVAPMKSKRQLINYIHDRMGMLG